MKIWAIGYDNIDDEFILMYLTLSEESADKSVVDFGLYMDEDFYHVEWEVC